MLRKIAPLALALLLAACADKSNGTDSDSQGSGGATDGSSSTTVVEPTTGGSADAGTTAGGMSEGMSETTASTGGTTGGETGGDADVEAACMAACEHIVECVPKLPGPVEDCRAGCIDQWGTPGCGQAGIDLLQCLVAMNCKQLEAYVNDDKAGVCAEAEDAANMVCDGAAVCEMGGSAGGNECSVSRDCDGNVEEYQCNGETCTCVIDGEPGESCADMGVCALTVEEQIAAGEACCGWGWS